MRPIKLEMEAFVSYKNLQIIDFTKIEGKNIFLITGETGAGKSTIFDAICFALYGKLSREDRDKAEFLKCHLADKKTLSRVKFTFKIQDKIYEIERFPRQKKYSEKAKKEIDRESTATLILPTGEVLTRISEINQKIEEIMGINDKQFRQIVMLAQGEFKKFLVANSSEKQEILRKTFGTEIYSQFTKELALEKNEKEGKIKEIQRNLRKLALSFSSTDEKIVEMQQAEEIEYNSFFDLAETILSKESEFFNKLKIDLDLKRDQFSEINLEEKKKLNEKISQMEKYEEEYSKIVKDEKRVLSLKQELKKIDKAIDIEPIYQSLLTKSSELLNFSESEKSGRIKLQALTNNLKISKSAYDKAIEKLKETEALSLKAEKLESIKEELMESINTKNQLKSLKASQEKTKNDIDYLTLILKELKTKKSLIRFSEALAQKTKLKNLDNLILNIEKNLNEKNQELKLANEEYFASSAAILREELKIGMVCPVCGEIIKEDVSKSEPHKTPNKEKILIIQNEKSKISEKLQKAKSDKENTSINLEKILSELEISAPQIEKEIDQKTQEIDQLMSKRKTFPSPFELTQSDANDEELLQEKLRELSSSFSLKEGQISQLEIVLSKALSKTKNMASAEEIDKEIEALSFSIMKIKKDFEDCENLFNKTKTEKERFEAALEQLIDTKETIRKNAKNLKIEFENSLCQKGIADEDEYKEIRLKFQERNSIKNTCDEFDKKKDFYNQVLTQLNKELKGKEKTDLNALNHLKTKLELEIKKTENDLEQLNKQIAVNENCVSNAKENLKLYDDNLKAYKEISSLSSLASGSTKSKMTFESYVLMFYFEEIISHANIRLSSMSKGRYYLYRKKEASGLNRLSGLDLEILDTYSGIKRHISTLSGGESFQASLSLALGLADVLQNHYGGIKIETMFIDEGFGSLDEKSIDSAVDTLYSLEKCGVLVGVISHVVHLREKIPTKLIVETGSDGSTVKLTEI